MRAAFLVVLAVAVAGLAAAQTGMEQTERAQDSSAPCGPGTTTGAGSVTQGDPGGSCPTDPEPASEGASTFVGNPWAWAVVAGVVVVVAAGAFVARTALRSRRA